MHGRKPRRYYIKGVRDAQRLTKEEFEFLSLCDSRHDLENTELANELMNRGFIRSCNKGEGLLDPWQKMNIDNRYFPAMNWMITGKCNYNCLHCFNASDNAPLMSEFSLEQAETLLDQAQACGINAFTITGGEPMCHKNFFEILEGIYKRNMFVEELNTNGFYITQQTLDRMKQMGCDPLIKISFDGLGCHDWLRNRKGAEENTLRAIKLCVDNGFRVKAQTNVHRHNVDSMLPTAKLLDEMGVSEMRIIRTTEVPRWNENAKGATLELKEYYDLMLDFAKKYIQNPYKMKIDIWQVMTICPEHHYYTLRPVECCEGEYRDSIPVCRGNRGMIAISANGNVFPCMQMSGTFEARGETFGNVHKDSLQTLLQYGKYLSEVCTTVKELSEKNETCKNCPYFKYCIGGCRALALAFTGTTLGTDPSKCLFFHEGYHKKINAIMGDWINASPMEISL